MLHSLLTFCVVIDCHFVHVALSVSMGHSSFRIEGNQELEKFTGDRRANKVDMLSNFGKQNKYRNMLCDKELKTIYAGKAGQLAQNTIYFLKIVYRVLQCCFLPAGIDLHSRCRVKISVSGITQLGLF